MDCTYNKRGICVCAECEMFNKSCPATECFSICKYFKKAADKSKLSPEQCLKKVLANSYIYLSDTDVKKVFNELKNMMLENGYAWRNLYAENQSFQHLNSTVANKKLNVLEKAWFVGQWVTLYEIHNSKDWRLCETTHPLQIATKTYRTLDDTLSVTFIANSLYGTIMIASEMK